MLSPESNNDGHLKVPIPSQSQNACPTETPIAEDTGQRQSALSRIAPQTTLLARTPMSSGEMLGLGSMRLCLPLPIDKVTYPS